MKNRKSTLKKIAAMAVALVMCMAMLPGAALAAGSTKTIYTKQDLIDLADDINIRNVSYTTVVLANDIDLGEDTLNPIGTWDRPFTGTFDGQEHTISNGYINGGNTFIRVGLFGCVFNGTVQDLTLDNIKVSNSSTSNSSGSNQERLESATGIAVGTLRSGTISGVHVTSSCTVSGYYRTGGIVGDTRGTSSEVTGCTNAGTVTSNNLYTGGIVGAAHDVSGIPTATGTTITGCYNMGDVTGTTNVGGIVGYADRATVTNCNNGAEGTTNPTITGTGNYGTGGIVGANVFNFRLIRPTVSSTIRNCKNYGNIVGGRAGGILGAYISAPNKSQPQFMLNCTIDDCRNYGAVSGTAGKCGAIFGYQISYANGDASNFIDKMGVIIQGCFYECTVNEVTATVPTPSTISIQIIPA